MANNPVLVSSLIVLRIPDNFEILYAALVEQGASISAPQLNDALKEAIKQSK